MLKRVIDQIIAKSKKKITKKNGDEHMETHGRRQAKHTATLLVLDIFGEINTLGNTVVIQSDE